MSKATASQKHKPGENPPAPGEVKLSPVVQLRIWYSLFWRSVVLLLVIAAFVEIGMRDFLEAPRYFLVKARDVATWLLIPITLWASGKIINKSFGRYRLALIDMQPDLPPSRIKKEKKPVDKKAKKTRDAASQPNENNTK